MTSESPENRTESIVCRDVHKWFGAFHVLRGINVTIYQGEVVVVFGPSGSGKSTFIRTINHLEEHHRGEIIVNGVALTHDIRNIDAVRRDVGMVFQSFNLFPHLTAMQNVTLAPRRVRKWRYRRHDPLGQQSPDLAVRQSDWRFPLFGTSIGGYHRTG